MLSVKYPKSAVSLLSWFLLGIPVLFVVGCFMHFIYNWSGELTVVGIFAPINESVWEHLKLTFSPMVIWWLAALGRLHRNDTISLTQWFVTLAVAELVCSLVIVCFYYTYTGAFGIESLALDIFSLFLGIAIAQGISFQIMKQAKFNRCFLFISICLLILLAIGFTVFTFIPPHIPMFRDSMSGKYGI